MSRFEDVTSTGENEDMVAAEIKNDLQEILGNVAKEKSSALFSSTTDSSSCNICAKIS